MGEKRNSPRGKQANQYDSVLKKSKPHVPLSLIRWVQITDLGGVCAEGSPSSGSGGWNSRLEVSSLRILRTLTATSWFRVSPGEVGPIGSSVGNFVGGFSSQEVSWVRSLSGVLKISVLCEWIRLTHCTLYTAWPCLLFFLFLFFLMSAAKFRDFILFYFFLESIVYF